MTPQQRAQEQTRFFTPSGRPIPPIPTTDDVDDGAEWVDLSDCDLDEEER